MDFETYASLIRNNRVKELQGQLIENLFRIDTQENLTRNTLLHVACQNGSKLGVKVCLRLGANLNIQNSKGYTPLHFAYMYGFTELGEYCISKGADDELRALDGRTCYECLAGLGTSLGTGMDV